MNRPTITSDKVNELIINSSSVQLVDVRSASEYNAGHIPNSTNIPYEEVASRLSDLSLESPIVLICQSGTRACLACDSIIGSRPNVFVLEGGFANWDKLRLPKIVFTNTTWSIERQVRFAAGMLVLLGVSLAVLVNPWYIAIAAFVGAGLTFSGVTNFCGMAALFAKMPWNQTGGLKNV